MVQIDFRYEGSLRCTATHVPSGTTLSTDAPIDNQGLGMSFSPTDLVATALGSCILTTMALVAARHGWDFARASARVEKKMVADPARRIGELAVHLRLPGAFDERARTTLERTARTCPVHASLGASVSIPIVFEWDPLAARERA